MTTHQIASYGADWKQDAMKTKELYSRHHHRHGDMRAGRGEEDRIRPNTEDTQYRKYDHSEFSGRVWHDKQREWGNENNTQPVNYGKVEHSFSFSYTRIEISYSNVFNGNSEKYAEDPMKAFEEFSKAAQAFVNKPDEKSYRALNDAMKNLMDSRFTPSHIGGNAQVSIFTTKNSALVSFQMEVTPAPAKSLEEAREDLHKNYNEETYTNYIRALSEKFKRDGVISHTNDSPTTPVYKSTIIFSAKSSGGKISEMHELKRPEYRNDHHGRFKVRNRDFSIGKLSGWQNRRMEEFRSGTWKKDRHLQVNEYAKKDKD